MGDGSRSAWATYDRAIEETTASISRRLEYYRRTANNMPALVHGMCFTPMRIQAGESSWKRYCPVSLTLGNELVACKDPRCVVEYKSNFYWFSSQECTRSFLSDPESFLQVPLPTALPMLLAA